MVLKSEKNNTSSFGLNMVQSVNGKTTYTGMIPLKEMSPLSAKLEILSQIWISKQMRLFLFWNTKYQLKDLLPIKKRGI